jgi:hypothetical protein
MEVPKLAGKIAMAKGNGSVLDAALHLPRIEKALLPQKLKNVLAELAKAQVAEQPEDLGLSSGTCLSCRQGLEQVVKLPRRIPCLTCLPIEPENLPGIDNEVRVDVFSKLEPIPINDGKEPTVASLW